MNEEHDNSLSDDQTIKDIIIDLRLVVDRHGKNFIKTKDLIHELARRLDGASSVKGIKCLEK